MILDTNAVSALFSGDEALAKRLAGQDPLHLPVIVIGEYRYGLLRSRHRKSIAQLLDTLIAESIVLTVDADTATAYAAIRDELRRKGTPIPENDLWIAALSRQHELPVATRDAHFDLVPRLARLSW
ncbi:MAG: PIN domain-containing protein [Thermoanaerobaculia bacterium]